MLAWWKIPPTDDRLKTMNHARWLMAHQMMLQQEQQEVRKYARILGVDARSFSKDEPQDGPVNIVPLTAFINPEAFKNVTETFEQQGEEDGEGAAVEIEESAYEQQVRELSKQGLTEIDEMSLELADRMERKLRRKIVNESD